MPSGEGSTTASDPVSTPGPRPAIVPGDQITPHRLTTVLLIKLLLTCSPDQVSWVSGSGTWSTSCLPIPQTESSPLTDLPTFLLLPHTP